jgi:murein L,D-transpeptidase YcbB/YkuD
VRKVRLQQLMAGTAVIFGLALVGSAGPALAQSQAEIDSRVPMPEPANVPPPSKADLTPAPAASAPSGLLMQEVAPARPVEAATPALTPEVKKEAVQTPAAPAPEVQKETVRAPAAAAPVASVPAVSAPAATVADSAVTDRLREQLTSSKKKERGALEAFYSSRNFAPLWVADGAASPRAKAAIAYLGGVAADGLNPADYPTPDFKATDAEGLAEAELKLTNTILTYAKHAQIGQVHYTRVSADIAYPLAAPEPAEILAKVANASDVAEALDSFNPQIPEYKALKQKLAEARGQTESKGPAPIPTTGPMLRFVKKQPMHDARVPALRDRLGVAVDKTDTTYDQAVAEAVVKYQKANDLQANGNLTTATLESINGPRRERTADIIVANMERLRWLPHELGKNHVVVNIPDYTLSLFHDGKVYWKTKIVVGKPGKPTPMLTADMKFITVNPTWNVPPSIIQNEYLPALQEDPQALERIGLKLTQDADGTLHVSQPPGDRNALGRIRFNFPNKFLVYQHDTPDKYLFAKDKRAFSHGCMRVENPLTYGEKLLSLELPNEHYTAAKLQSMFGGSEININFPSSLPVHITYQTAFVDEDGKLQIREDIYGRDRETLAILNNSAERKVADTAIDRPSPNTSAKPVKVAPGTYGGPNSYSSGGPNFFERLFGLAPTPPAPVPTAHRSQRRMSER